MEPLIWPTLLLLLGLGLVVLEVFVPSGGLIGFLSLSAVVGSIWLAFSQGQATGLAFLLIAIVALPGAFGLAIKIMPETPFGRRLLLKVPTSEEVLPDHHRLRGLQELIGKVGKAKSLMLPSGALEIGGRIVDAVSEGVAIEPGQLVRVIEVRGNRVVVRPANSGPAKTAPGDKLSQPIDSLGLDPFEDPIA